MCASVSAGMCVHSCAGVICVCPRVCSFVRLCVSIGVCRMEIIMYMCVCIYTYIDVLMFRRILKQTHTYVCGDVLVCADVCRRM